MAGPHMRTGPKAASGAIALDARDHGRVDDLWGGVLLDERHLQPGTTSRAIGRASARHKLTRRQPALPHGGKRVLGSHAYPRS